jgi:ribonuclease VapC
MFVDACAIIALLSEEPEAQRVSDAIASAKSPFTSPVALLEAVLNLARQDKFDLQVSEVEPVVVNFLQERGIEVRDLPPAPEATRLAVLAADRYRSGRRGLNLADCFHYACAKFYDVPILATADEFRSTDLQTVP